MSKRDSTLGHYPAATVVRVGGVLTAAVADTGSKLTIIDPRLAVDMVFESTKRTGHMAIGGKRMRGRVVRVAIEAVDSPCKATVDAFVPNPGEDFTRGVLLGMEFLQKAKLRVDGETGTVYCPASGAFAGVPSRRRGRLS